jgi:hypothetical protein
LSGLHPDEFGMIYQAKLGRVAFRFDCAKQRLWVW